MNEEEKIKKAQVFGIILLVVLAGMMIVDGVFHYIYGEALESGSCNLCYELNPDLAECKDYVPDPFVSYGEK